MVRTHVMHQELIKRSGIIAASFLITTLSLVIITPANANALLKVELPLGDNLSPITDRVNGLVNKSLGLPITVNVGTNLKVDTPVADVNVGIPVVPAVVDGVTKPLDGTVNGLSNVLEPVTDNTVPAVRSALSRTLGGGGGGGTPNPQPQPPVSSPDDISPSEDLSVAGASATTIDTSTEEPVAQQPVFFGGVASFFASTLPSTLQDIARSIAGKDVGIGPIIISIILFIVTLGAVGSIVYASNHGGVLSLGRYRWTLFGNGRDQTEMATFIVVAISFGVVAIFLALTTL
jgi:hypothetical protein